MKNKKAILKELKNNCSVNYKGWLKMLLRHIEKYGEQPQYSKAEFCDWLKDGGIKKEIYKTKVLANTNGSYTIISENNTIYEIESCNNVIKIINNGNYEKWETPMCYNSYIGIL